MKRIDFTYTMRIGFDQPIASHRFTVKCLPQDTERQRIEEVHLEIYPNEFLSESRDSFGNRCIYGYTKESHEEFWIALSGTATTGLAAYEEKDDLCHAGIYKYQSALTKPGPALQVFSDRIPLAGGGNLEVAEQIMEELHQDFQYVPGVTGIATSAEEAMQLGEGVCQDYAHILLALCRMQRIPARYVVGLLLGEGRSHAWVEILTEDGKWVGLDPTNYQLVGENHLKISSGRDYGDCLINQGYFTGLAAQSQEIQAVLTERVQ